MNEITFTGNVSKIYDRRVTASGITIFSFDLAIDNSYFHHTRNRWIPRTRFQPVRDVPAASREHREHPHQGHGDHRHRQTAG